MTSSARPALRATGVVMLVVGLIAAALAGLPGSHAAPAAGAGRAFSAPQGARLVSVLTAAPVATTESTVQVGDETRDYLLGGAPAVTGVGAPLLLLFHGLDQVTPDFLGDVGILDAAARAGVIVAAPESPENAWNDGRFGPDGPDDDSFAMAIISQLAASGVIDPARVTVAGFSNGAGMAMELASRHPSAIAAVVSVDGELLSGPNQVLPGGPVPAFLIHGTDDPVQPIDGRIYESDRYPGYISESDTIDAFLAADGEAGVTPTQVVAARHRNLLVGQTTVTRWASPGAAPVTFAAVSGMGHKWPTLACTPIAVSAALAARIATAQHTAARLAALRKRALRPGGARLVATLPALRRLATAQAQGVSRARAAAALVTAGKQAAVAALLPSAGVTGCENAGGPDTRATDVSANSLILGAAVSARQGSDTL